MTDTITLTGLVATEPRHIVTSESLAITNFRLASAQRKFDRAQDRWVDVDTNWYTITSFRQLAINSAASIKKGERVVVTGRLRIREWDNGERNGMNIDIEADAIGHDMSWGTSTFSRIIKTATPDFPGAAESDDSEPSEPSPAAASVDESADELSAEFPVQSSPKPKELEPALPF